MQSGRLSDLQNFYELMAKLAAIGAVRTLSSCTGRMQWPRQGVYFFMEDGEVRSNSGTGPRIVRVGTHALKEGSATTFWNRLSQHRGTSSGDDGNHRGSIFRLIVGTALLRRAGETHSTWGQGNNAPKSIRMAEKQLEQKVSATLGVMNVLFLSIPDAPGPESQRGYIERNAIALLSNFKRNALDPPGPDWLGHFCDRERVRMSGLWNSNHVDEQHDGRFLAVLEDAILKMRDEQCWQ